MTYDYYIEFFADRPSPQRPIQFRHPLQVGDILQLEKDGEFHLVRLITHTPSGLTLWLSGKGQNIADLLLSEPEFTHHDSNDASSELLDVVLTWQTRTRYPLQRA